MQRMGRFLFRYLLCIALLNLAACSTMRSVDLQRAVQTSNARGVEYGLRVKVEMLDGRRAQFRVTEMGPEGIGNGEAYYRYAEMKQLKVEDPNSNARENTANWILGILGVVALVALVANSDSVKVCSPSPCPEG